MSSFGRRQDGQRYESGASAVSLTIHSHRTGSVEVFDLAELGPGGLKFRGATPQGGLLRGDVLDATITRGGRPLTLSGEVAWVREGDEVEGGMRFDSLTPEQRDRLAALVALLQLGDVD